MVCGQRCCVHGLMLPMRQLQCSPHMLHVVAVPAHWWWQFTSPGRRFSDGCGSHSHHVCVLMLWTAPEAPMSGMQRVISPSSDRRCTTTCRTETGMIDTVSRTQS
jgi:hypothetical protein